MLLFRGIKHQEPSAARTDQLSSERAVGHRMIVPVVDPVVAHARSLAFLRCQCTSISLANSSRLPASSAARLCSPISFVMEVFEHRRVVLLRACLWSSQDRGRAAGIAGEEEQEVVLQVDGFPRNLAGAGLDATVAVESEGR